MAIEVRRSGVPCARCSAWHGRGSGILLHHETRIGHTGHPHAGARHAVHLPRARRRAGGGGRAARLGGLRRAGAVRAPAGGGFRGGARRGGRRGSSEGPGADAGEAPHEAHYGFGAQYEDAGPRARRSRAGIDLGRLKPIVRALSKPYFDEEGAACAQWLSERYLAPLSSCVRLFTPPGGVPRMVRAREGYWRLEEPAVGEVDDRWVVPGPGVRFLRARARTPSSRRPSWRPCARASCAWRS